MGPGPAGRRGPRGSSARLSGVPTCSCLAVGPTRSSPAPGRSRSANALQQQAFRADSLPAGSAARVDPWGIRASTESVPQAEPVAGPGGGRALRLCTRRPVRPIWSNIPDGSLIRTRVNYGPPAVEHSRTCPPRYRQRNRESSPRTVLSPSRPPGQECSGRGRRTSADGHLLQITRRSTQV